MIKTTIKRVKMEVIESYICDVCKKNYSVIDDELEIQEFVHIEDAGGYNSIIGDGVSYRLDMCQHCFNKLLGIYIVKS